MIISFFVIGLILLVLAIIGREVDKQEEAKAKAKAKEERIKAETEAEAEEKARQEKLASFKAWWRNSRFNNFIVLEKRTPAHFNGKRYMAVRHVETNKCYNLEVDVTTYFNFDVGAELCVTNVKYDYITEEALAEFTAETGVDGSLIRVWMMEEDLWGYSRPNYSFDEF